VYLRRCASTSSDQQTQLTMVKRKRVESPAAHTDNTNNRSDIIKALDKLGTASATPNAKPETVDNLDSTAIDGVDSGAVEDDRNGNNKEAGSQEKTTQSSFASESTPDQIFSEVVG